MVGGNIGLSGWVCVHSQVAEDDGIDFANGE
jgi:hypothetical protein